MNDQPAPSPAPQDQPGARPSEVPPPLPPPCPRCGAPLLPGRTCAACVMAAAHGLGAQGAAMDGPGRPSVEDLDGALLDYDVQAVIGRGGMGTVYRARHRKLDRLVAIKVLEPPPGEADAAAFTERFEREARVLASLDHPHIVRIHDFGRTGEPLELNYLVLEYVEGANLRDLLRAGKLAPREVLELVPQICEGLQAAHALGIVHRDVKPENILVDGDGRVRIADFGLAKMTGAEPTGLGLTRTSQTFGTLHYMAPEQVRGAGGVDHRADLYSLGVVLYEMLTGELPIGRFPAPSEKARETRPFDDVVLKALESEPAKRHQQAGEVRRELTTLERATRIGHRPGAQQRAAGARASGSSSTSGAARTIVFGVLLLVFNTLPWLEHTHTPAHMRNGHYIGSLVDHLTPFSVNIAGGLPLWANWLAVAAAGIVRAVQAREPVRVSWIPIGLNWFGLGFTLLFIVAVIMSSNATILFPAFIALLLHGANVWMDLAHSLRRRAPASERRSKAAQDVLRRRKLAEREAKARKRARMRQQKPVENPGGEPQA